MDSVTEDYIVGFDSAMQLVLAMLESSMSKAEILAAIKAAQND